MRYRISNKIIGYLSPILTEQPIENIDKMQYYIAGFIINLPKLALLFLAAYKLHIFKNVLLLILIYGVLRHFSKGIHAKTSVGCFIMSMANYLGIAYVSTVLRIPDLTYSMVFVICLCIYALYAPSGTEKNPVGPMQYKWYKVISFLIVLLYFIISYYVNYVLRNMLLLAVVSQAVCIVPITYTLSKQKGGIIYGESD